MMNLGDTVTKSTLQLERSDIKSLPRAESNPPARKRRIEHKTGDFKTSKTPRRILDDKTYEINDNIIEKQIELLTNEDLIKFDGDIESSEIEKVLKKPPIHPDLPKKSVKRVNKRDDSARLRKTIQWLEEGARKLRENLADVRTELYEERKAFRLAKRDIENKNQETAKYLKVIAELKMRLSQSSRENLKDENNSEKSGKKRLIVELSEADTRKIKASDSGGTKKRKLLDDSELRKMECEIRNLRDNNKKLEDELMIISEELNQQHEKYEDEMSAVKKAVKNDKILMMEEIRSRERSIEKLEKLIRKKTRDELMRKLRESERSHQICLEPNSKLENHVMSVCKGDCESVGEVERLRELAVEQQEVIEYLRQALKEKERKLDQLSNKKRKEEFYKQWLELEPVAEVDDEEEHEGDSALSSAPSSLSPQPGGWQTNGVTRETYEALLLEVDELQTKYFEEHEELAHAKSQVRDLEKALLQETRGSQNSRRALSDKLKEAEEREAGLVAQMSELREQNELLEFRVLELEESEPRKSPDTADSGIVSPEPPALFKDANKQRDRAVATVIPYNTYKQSLSPDPVQKSLLSLQESGIFEDDDDVELASCGTQTDIPAGELLQEVQRLQELRERFQERAVKVPVTLDAFENEDNRFKDKIRELEETIGKYRESEEKKSRDQMIAKQREEDLLDENYRLTERLYCLENEIQNLKNKVNVVDVGTMTKKVMVKNASTFTESFINNHSPLSRSQKMFYDSLGNLQGTNCSKSETEGFRISLHSVNKQCPNCELLKKDYEEKIQNLAKAESCLRKQMADFQQTEDAFAKTWTQLETDHTERFLKIQQELTEKILLNKSMGKRISELEDCIRNHSCATSSKDEVDCVIYDAFGTSKGTLTNRTEEPMDVDVDKLGRSLQTDVIKTEGFKEEKGSKRGVSCVHLQFEDYPENNEDDNAICKSDADDEKVRKRESRHSEFDGWAMRNASSRRNNCKSVIDVHRLVLYPEICV